MRMGGSDCIPCTRLGSSRHGVAIASLYGMSRPASGTVDTTTSNHRTFCCDSTGSAVACREHFEDSCSGRPLAQGASVTREDGGLRHRLHHGPCESVLSHVCSACQLPSRDCGGVADPCCLEAPFAPKPSLTELSFRTRHQADYDAMRT